MKIFHYLYFNFHFHLGDPPLVLEDYFLPESGRHHHLKVYKTRINHLTNHNKYNSWEENCYYMYLLVGFALN